MLLRSNLFLLSYQLKFLRVCYFLCCCFVLLYPLCWLLWFRGNDKTAPKQYGISCLFFMGSFTTNNRQLLSPPISIENASSPHLSECRINVKNWNYEAVKYLLMDIYQNTSWWISGARYCYCCCFRSVVSFAISALFQLTGTWRLINWIWNEIKRKKIWATFSQSMNECFMIFWWLHDASQRSLNNQEVDLLLLLCNFVFEKSIFHSFFEVDKISTRLDYAKTFFLNYS